MTLREDRCHGGGTYLFFVLISVVFATVTGLQNTALPKDRFGNCRVCGVEPEKASMSVAHVKMAIARASMFLTIAHANVTEAEWQRSCSEQHVLFR